MEAVYELSGDKNGIEKTGFSISLCKKGNAFTCEIDCYGSKPMLISGKLNKEEEKITTK